MTVSTQERPLSPYLKGLVEKGLLPGYVARILSRLPDWKQQREAVEDWGSRLDDPAKEIVAEFENMKETDTDRYPIDCYQDGNEVVITYGYNHLYDTLDGYVEGIRSKLERFLKQAPCPFCDKPLMGDRRHVNCQTLWKYTRDRDYVRGLLQSGKGTQEHEQQLKLYEAVVNEFQEAFRAGHFPDGVSWTTPRYVDDTGKSKVVGTQ
jgi:hypothetical protein